MCDVDVWCVGCVGVCDWCVVCVNECGVVWSVRTSEKYTFSGKHGAQYFLLTFTQFIGSFIFILVRLCCVVVVLCGMCVVWWCDVVCCDVM